MGVSLPATGEGHHYSWGDGLVRTEPGLYDLCYCNKAAGGKACTQGKHFVTPAGSVRVATSKEFQYNTRPADNQPRSYDKFYALVLAFLLPVLFAVAMCIGWYRRRGIPKNEPEAPPLFKVGLSFVEIAQQRAEQMHQVKQVMEVRLAAPADDIALAARGGQSGAAMPMKGDVPDFRTDKRDRRRADIAQMPHGSHGGDAGGAAAPPREQARLPGSVEDDAPPGVLAPIRESDALTEPESPASWRGASGPADVSEPMSPESATSSPSWVRNMRRKSSSSDVQRPKAPNISFGLWQKNSRVLELLDLDPND